MSEIRDFFIKSLDETEGGINHLMKKFDQAICKYDNDIWNRLNDQELKPQYYGFRYYKADMIIHLRNSELTHEILFHHNISQR
jgi:hypothetical protein